MNELSTLNFEIFVRSLKSLVHENIIFLRKSSSWINPNSKSWYIFLVELMNSLQALIYLRGKGLQICARTSKEECLKARYWSERLEAVDGFTDFFFSKQFFFFKIYIYIYVWINTGEICFYLRQLIIFSGNTDVFLFFQNICIFLNQRGEKNLIKGNWIWLCFQATLML